MNIFKKKYLATIAVFIVGVVIGFSNVKMAYADVGPKPSIVVKISGLDTTNYLVDLFVEAPEKYDEKMECNCEGGERLHELNFDGWISESTRRSFLLIGDIFGNDEYTNMFTYFGVPDVYKIVIINNDTGEIKISDVLKRQKFDEVVNIEYASMRTDVSNPMASYAIKSVITIVLTVAIELLIAVMMKMRRFGVIAVVNIVTNILLGLALSFVQADYFLVFGIGEILVFLAELAIYALLIKGISKKKILLYTFVANLVTVLVTFIAIKIA